MQPSWPPTSELRFNNSRGNELWMEKLAAKWPETLITALYYRISRRHGNDCANDQDKMTQL